MSAPLSESFSIGTSDDGLSFARILEREAERKRLGGVSASTLVNGAPVDAKRASILEDVPDAVAVAERPPLQWLFRGLIKRKQAGLVTGAWKAGKSMAAIHMAFARVLQTPLAPANTQRPKDYGAVAGKRGNALYIACERGSSLPGRLKAWQQIHDPNWEQYKACGRKVFFHERAVNLLDPAHAAEVLAFCQKNDVDFVVVDTLRSSLAAADVPGENPEMNQQYMTRLVETGAGCLAEKLDGSVVIVHHPKKDDPDSTSGAGSIEGSASFKILVKNESGARFLALRFQNEAGVEDVRLDFKVQEVVVGVDDEGENITAGAFVPLSGGYQKSPAPQNTKALHAIASALDERGLIDNPTMFEAIKTQAPEIKQPRGIKARLLKEGHLERVGTTHYRFTDKGRRALQITLGERRVPLEAAS